MVISFSKYFDCFNKLLTPRTEINFNFCVYLILKGKFPWIVSELMNTTRHWVCRVWRYQMGNQNPYIEEEQTTQWPKEKVQQDKQRSTKHTYKPKDRVIRTPLKTGGELGCSGRVSSSCSTSGTRRVNLVTNLAIVSLKVVCRKRRRMCTLKSYDRFTIS